MENKELIVRMRNELNLSRIKGYGRLEYLIYEYLTTQIGGNPYEPVKIRAIELLKATKIGDTNHVFLRKTTRNMIVGVEILTDTKEIIQVPTFQKITYKKGGEIEFQFSRDFVPYIFELKERFTERGFGSLVELKSEHARPLYLLCMQFKNLPQKRDFYLSVDELRFLFDLPKNQYKQFADIKRRILKPATEQITNNTDVKIEFEVDKPNRKIEGVTFYFSFGSDTNEQQTALPCDFKELTDAGRQLVDDYQISPSTAVELQILATTDEHLIYAMSQYNKKLDAKYKKGERVDNLPRYSETALRELIPTILISGVVEKEKIKAEEKQREEKLKQEKVTAEEKKKESQAVLESEFKAFCARGDLLDVLEVANLGKLLQKPLINEQEIIFNQAKKEVKKIYLKELEYLTPSDVFEVLTDSVKGVSFTTVRLIEYRNLKVYLKNILQPLF